MYSHKKTSKARKHAEFSVDVALLEELGERLVSRPDIALSELIKNAHDADSPSCEVDLNVVKKRLVVRDKGTGISEADFVHKWMKIGTRNKEIARESPVYGRPYAGSKGIGRFASRFLGDRLTIISISRTEGGGFQRIRARFIWNRDTRSRGDVQDFKAFYTVEPWQRAECGTTLVISKCELAAELKKDRKDVASQVLKLTDPYGALEQPNFNLSSTTQGGGFNVDPGFEITLGGDFQTSDGKSKHADDSPKKLQSLVMENFVARARIEANNGLAKVELHWRNKGKVFERSLPLREIHPEYSLSSPLLLDIRYFPVRKGTFSGGDVDGVVARSWVADNCGIAVIDSGFRVPPFGQSGDDWLDQNLDESTSRRSWRTELARSLFPMSPEEKSQPKQNPALYLPSRGQVVGAVMVASRSHSSGNDATDLIPSINREGYVRNRAFTDLYEIARFSLELIAKFDKKFALEREQRIYEDNLSKISEDFKEAIHTVEMSPSIAPMAREQIVFQLLQAQERVRDTRTYESKKLEALSEISLLGVMAGFITHEFEKVLLHLEDGIRLIKQHALVDPHAKPTVDALESTFDLLRSYMDYSRLMVEQAGTTNSREFSGLSQIRFVVDSTFAGFTNRERISVDLEECHDFDIHGVPVAAFSGIVMNLYTNALKAILAKHALQDERIRITLIRNAKGLVLTVSDTGIGVPKTIRNRIFDAMFTTTRSVEDHTGLGSGMGLGLSLTQRVINTLGGKIELREPPATGFASTFEVTLPLG